MMQKTEIKSETNRQKADKLNSKRCVNIKINVEFNVKDLYYSFSHHFLNFGFVPVSVFYFI